jgi:hypothetical protein
MEKEIKTYNGLINAGDFGENFNALFIGDSSEPIAKTFYDDFYNQNVTVRYWISEIEMSRELLKQNTLLCISGYVDADYSSRYSEITGYLWTDEELNIGGHNLLNELTSSIGKYVYLEVEIN